MPERLALGGDELVLHVRGEQAGRGQDPRMWWYEHARDLKLLGDVAREQRAGARRLPPA